MISVKSMTKPNEHEDMVKALLDENSLAALIYLLDAGRELEFKVRDTVYFVSKDKAQKYVSIWKGQEEQSFDHAYDLIEYSLVEGIPFYSAWKDAEIMTLF